MIYDLHNDLLTALPPEKFEKYLSGAKGNRIILAVWTTEIENIKPGFFRSLCNKVVRRPSRLFAIEDLHFLKYCPLSMLEEMPFRYVGLTWNYDNALAGGAHGSGDLTLLGRKVLSEAHRLGIAVDTAHLNRKSFFKVLETHEGKLLDSHCCFNSCRSHPRNLSDDQIRELIARGGIIGVTLEKSFLSDAEATEDDLIRHIDTFVSKFGCDNLAIGTDYNGCTPIRGLESYNALEITLKIGLGKLGYTEKDIEKILNSNALDFFEGA